MALHIIVSSMAGRGDAAKLDVNTGPPLFGGLNSTSMCSVDVEPVRVRMRTLLGSLLDISGSSDDVGVRRGEVEVTVEDSAGTIGGKLGGRFGLSYVPCDGSNSLLGGPR